MKCTKYHYIYEVLTQLKEVKADSGNILKEQQQKSTFGMTLQRILHSFKRLRSCCAVCFETSPRIAHLFRIHELTLSEPTSDNLQNLKLLIKCQIN